MLSIGSKLSTRALAQTLSLPRQFKEGYGVVYGKHQMPFWEDNEIELKTTRSGAKIDWGKYTNRPFRMNNLAGRQPSSVTQKMLKYNEGYGSEYNTGTKQVLILCSE